MSQLENLTSLMLRNERDSRVWFKRETQGFNSRVYFIGGNS